MSSYLSLQEEGLSLCESLVSEETPTIVLAAVQPFLFLFLFVHFCQVWRGLFFKPALKPP